MQNFLLQKRGTTWIVTRMYSRFNPGIRSEEIVCYLYKKRFDTRTEALAFAADKANEFKRKDPKVTPQFFIVKKISNPIN